jgi:superfamily I DNA/RNA helicase
VRENLFANLNSEQSKAAMRLWDNDINALQIVAGAGSGKTTTLIAAVAAAIEAGRTAEFMAVITFSRRAAHELKERLAAHNIEPGFCGTMHALAWKILRADGDRSRLIRDPNKRKAEIMRQMYPDWRDVPDEVVIHRDFLGDEISQNLNELYKAELRKEGLIDFDEMITQATTLGVSGRYQTLFVDEFQDTSPDQLKFIQALQPEKLLVVGDDWQSIYAFRGADVQLMREFPRTFSDAERSYLLHNYRSQSRIVDLGNRTIKLSQSYVKKRLRSTLPRQAKPVLYFTTSQRDPAGIWRLFTEKLVAADGSRQLGISSGQPLTILVRTNALRLMLEKNLPANAQVMTVHKSKGLEFDQVLIFGVAEGIMPHQDNGFDEEVRLLYVAMTRAKHFLGFVGWEGRHERSDFLPLLMRRCKLAYF